MEVKNSFFAHLLKLKRSEDFKDENRLDENKKDKNDENLNENEWLQEYEMIYRSYAIERY